MKINDIYTLEIIDTNENGMGIARQDGMVVFVPGLLPGERAEVCITSVEKNYAAAVTNVRLCTSNERAADACPSAGECGGCTLGFMSYERENRIKKNTVCSALRRAGLPYDLVENTVFPEMRTGYRNKIVLHYHEKDRYFGFRRAQSLEVLPFVGCLLVPSCVNDIVHWTNQNISLLSAVNPEAMHIRTSLDGVTVSVYGRNKDRNCVQAYRTALCDAKLGVNEVLYFPCNKNIISSARIRDKIAGLQMHFTSEAFRQVNTPAFEKLLALVHTFAEEKPFGCAADLYCGSGIIGLSLAQRFPDAKFWGIEINAEAIADAHENASVNGITNMTFFAGDAATFRKRLPKQEHPELIVVDPPRAGLSKEMRHDLVELAPERIIYVSCNPQTMARDLAQLCSDMYTIRSVVPVNMFPRTKHVESIACLNRI